MPGEIPGEDNVVHASFRDHRPYEEVFSDQLRGAIKGSTPEAGNIDEALGRIINTPVPPDETFDSDIEKMDDAQLLALAARVDLTAHLWSVALAQEGKPADEKLERLLKRKETLYGKLSPVSKTLATGYVSNLMMYFVEQK